MVSQRRERERPRRKHTNDHGQKDVCYILFLFLLVVTVCISFTSIIFTTHHCHLFCGSINLVVCLNVETELGFSLSVVSGWYFQGVFISVFSYIYFVPCVYMFHPNPNAVSL